ncbi:MAG: thiolase family protein [Gammaproteobacteria bacterium]
MSVRYFEKECAISGVGQSEVSRGSTKSALELTVDAAMDALADAGLKRADIDGIACWPGGDNDASGFSPVSIPDIQEALRLRIDWYSGTRETSGQLGAVFNAIGAIAAGLANHVLVYRTVYEATARKQRAFANAMIRPDQRTAGFMSTFAPYHLYAAATNQALFFQRYMHEAKLTYEQLGWVALNGRRHAALNPNAVYRTPITMADYLASPIISSPLRLYDCDVPCDGATAVIVSRKELAKDLRNPVIRFEAIGSSMRDRNSWSDLDNLATQATPAPARHLWSRTDFKPADVRMAQLYDGFSFHTLAWLESFGFCERYGAGHFVEGGKRTALDGELPLNTSGGQLSQGRLHGYGQIFEACTQIWGRAGARQIPGEPRTAVTSTAGGPLAGCLLLVRE